MHIGRLKWLAAALLAVSGIPLAAGAADFRQWDFRVYLDGDPIGEHRFRVDASGPATKVSSRARFDVKLLFITAYRYRHDNLEFWRGGCLSSIDAKTDDNGDRYRIQGARIGGNFVLRAGGEETSLPDCPMSFAYWNPEILSANRLLNSQTGEYQPARVQRVAREIFRVEGREVSATRYRLVSGGQNIYLWYDDDGRWVGLESEVDGGRMLSYRLESFQLAGTAGAAGDESS